MNFDQGESAYGYFYIKILHTNIINLPNINCRYAILFNKKNSIQKQQRFIKIIELWQFKLFKTKALGFLGAIN